MEKYDVEVLFITPVNVTVEAEDIDDAMDIAENTASAKFETLLNNGLLGTSDFYCEAQTP